MKRLERLKHYSATLSSTYYTYWNPRSLQVLRPTQYINPALLKAAQGEAACRKCEGKVFELERIDSKAGTYHKQCFACDGCRKSLDSTLVYHYEAREERASRRA